MTTSFDALNEETRPLTLLDDPQPAPPRRAPLQIATAALALLLPVLIVVLL